MIDKKSEIVSLFKEIEHGNTVAFDTLFSRYYYRLLAFAQQYTKQIESAEEITSELFVKIWLKRAGLSKITNPEVYLFIAIKNAGLNLIRSEKKRDLLFTSQPSLKEKEKIDDNYVAAIEENELQKILDKSINSLPEQRKLIFKLIKEEGLKSKEVAEILGISIRTVENQLYKAIKTLAQEISSYLGYHPQAKISRKQALSGLPILFFL
jgi:RNA polymerase sigma-70 factor (family 1)